jgi:hypothetical protein
VSFDREPCRGAVAVCGHDTLGLICVDAPILVTYPDGSSAKAWTGIHLTDKTASVGAPWSSAKPRVVGHVSDFEQVGLNAALDAACRSGDGLCFVHDREADGERMRAVVMTVERYEQMSGSEPDRFSHTHLTPDDLREFPADREPGVIVFCPAGGERRFPAESVTELVDVIGDRGRALEIAEQLLTVDTVAAFDEGGVYLCVDRDELRRQLDALPA